MKIFRAAIFYCLLALGVSLSLSTSANAKSSNTLDKIIEQMNASNGLRITFDLYVDGKPIRGDYYAYSQNFYYDTPQMKAWYNAKDLWVYLNQNDEINLSTPLKEDLTEINPLLNLNTLKEQKFNIKESKSGNSYTLTGTPSKGYRGAIERIVVTADKNYQPTSMTIKEKGVKETITVKVVSFKRGSYPEMNDKGFFTFVSKKLPGKTIIDLR